MYQNYLPNNMNYYQPVRPNNGTMTNNLNPNDDRFVGGLAFPFLLGGVTGAALAPAFWRPPYSPYYRPYQPYPPYPPYPYYRPY